MGGRRRSAVVSAPAAIDTGRQLSITQKLHHLQGWVPWLRDSLLWASLLLLGLAAIQVMVAPGSSLVPLGTLGAGVTSVVLHQVGRHAIIYRTRLSLPWSHTVGAICAIFSLTLTIGAAWTLALFGKRTPFNVTPKAPTAQGRWWQDIKHELACGAYVTALAIALLVVHGGALSIAALVPALYFPLIAPAYVL